MDIRKIPVSKINLAPYNPRVDLQPGDPECEKLKRSIEEFGCVETLVWNERTGYLVGGHQRFKILVNELGATEVTVSVVNLDDIREKTLNIALNKISGAWDEEMLAQVLAELQDSELDHAITGFDDKEAADLIAQFTFKSDEDTEFTNEELDLDEFAEDKFDCHCPRCGFVFNPKDPNPSVAESDHDTA
ncbi:transcriptional regulator [Brevibacillus brevis]|uniref:ParB N-terminal domain-containing protein n=1 Tax=Brevibacillus brevis TaxID=1393 RepID=UPI000B3A710A|nr:ParB N-terminal domain-containing protein [Brevibacillus brevis]MBH0332437.1 transcriptional regulator [Brevibacillus brevis]OUQ88609.1 transcriptional regulator [Brevibacillus brevis]